jgi:hypothetical protein
MVVGWRGAGFFASLRMTRGTEGGVADLVSPLWGLGMVVSV